MSHALRQLTGRFAVFLRAKRKLGWVAAFKLALVRMSGTRGTFYRIHPRGFLHPMTIRGGKSTDAWALYELLVLDEYGFVGDLQSPRFIIDAGANIGTASVYFLHKYPTAHIVAVEPDPDNFALCQKNLSPYGDRVTLVHGAVWKEAGQLFLDTSLGEEWRRTVRAGRKGEPMGVRAFPVESLIAMGNGPVDLLKLDVEGAEREVFGPGAQQWLPSVRNIVIELHAEDCSQRFFEALSSYRYDLIQSQQQKQPLVACRNLRAASN